MKKKIFLLLLLPFLFFLSCSKDSDQNLEDEIERTYTKSIERIFSNNFEERLIEKAENFYPERSKVVDAATYYEGEIPQTGYWYYDNFDGVNIPFALTADAVDYYSGLIDAFNVDKKANFFISAEMEYTANITFENSYLSPETDSYGNPIETENYESVYVVHCTLSWFQYCGSLCAMWIDKERVAIFNEEGVLLKVYLDGPISVPVS